MLSNIYNLLFSKFFTFKGRSSRKEYIIKILLYTLILILGIYTFDKCTDPNISTVTYVLCIDIISAILLIQYFPLAVRRLHDLNESGWYVLITFLPFGQLLILWLMLKKGTSGINKYGEEPSN